MGALFAWIGLSIAVGVIGSGRRIGFFGAFIASLFLSPLIGGIIAALSKSKDDEAREAQALKLQQQQAASLQNMQAQQAQQAAAAVNQRSISEELESLQRMKDAGQLTEIEFNQAKRQILKPDLY